MFLKPVTGFKNIFSGKRNDDFFGLFFAQKRQKSYLSYEKKIVKSNCPFILFFSHELQTCDWPRNVVCVSGKRNGEITEFTESLKNDDGDGQDHERVPRLLVEDVNFGQKNVPVSWTRVRLILVI